MYGHRAMDNEVSSLEDGTRRFQILTWDAPYFTLMPSDPERTIDTGKNWSTLHQPMADGRWSAGLPAQCNSLCFKRMFHFNLANRFPQEQKNSGCDIPSGGGGGAQYAAGNIEYG